MTKKSYWISAGKFTLGQRIAMLFFGVMSFYLLVRTLEKEEYGTWMLFITTSQLILMAREGFFKKPLIRYINKLEDEERKKLQASSFAVNLLFSLASGALLLGFSGFLSEMWGAPGLKELFAIYFVTNLFMAVFSHCNNVLEANFRFNGTMMGHFLNSGLFFSCIVWFSVTDTHLTLFALGLCYSASAFVAAFAMWLYCRDLLSYRFLLTRKWAMKLVGYGKYTLGTNISGILLRNTDIWMIGLYLNPAAVAVYNVAIRVANLFEVPTMAMAAMIFPQAVKKAQAEGESSLKELYEKSVTVILLLVAPLVVIVIIFSNDIVRLLAGEGYAEAGYILNITMLYGLIVPFNKQMGILLDAIGKAKLNMLFVIRNALINVCLNALMIPLMGVAGAAYATLSTFFIVMIINQIYLHRKYKVEMTSMVGYSRYFFIRIKKMLAGSKSS